MPATATFAFGNVRVYQTVLAIQRLTQALGLDVRAIAHAWSGV